MDNATTTTRWLGEHVATIAGHAYRPSADNSIAPITDMVRGSVLPGIDLWDMWPVQLVDGSTARFDGAILWMVLSAPRLLDPDLRHGIARIRLVLERNGDWIDCGPAMPADRCPGSREWAGSALYDSHSGRVTLFFTAAGHRGEAVPTFAQRLFQASGTLSVTATGASIDQWTPLHESIVADGIDYVVVDQAQGVPGFIKGFRDPAHFRDPADGRDYLLFTASIAGSTSVWNGAIGVARARGPGHSDWELLPPLVSADGLNNELERPHIVARDGLYYLFWSTQRRVFAPDGPNGPNGLYGMVANHVLGPYRPLNGSGLVAANPVEAPYQTYSWWVTGELEVAAFIEMPGLMVDPALSPPDVRRAHFGGTPAPRFRIALEGDRAWVVGSAL